MAFRSMVVRSFPAARFAALLCTTLSLALVPLSSNAQSTSPVHTGPMPDSRFYSLSFHHILYLYNNDAQAGVADLQAKSDCSLPTSALDSYYRCRLGATLHEESAFLAEAQSWASEVTPVDAQAHSIITAIRARTPGGKLAPGEQPPDPPQVLVDLQQQRDAITLKHVSHLRAAFGEARFTQLDDQARHAAHLTFHASAPSGHSNPMATQGREDQ